MNFKVTYVSNSTAVFSQDVHDLELFFKGPHNLIIREIYNNQKGSLNIEIYSHLKKERIFLIKMPSFKLFGISEISQELIKRLKEISNGTTKG